MSFKVLIVDDHDIVRAGLRSILTMQKDVKVVGEAHNGRMALEVARDLLPNLVLMDLSMPDLNGVEATRQLLHQNPKIKVIAISMHVDRHFVSEALRAGIAGFLAKNSAGKELPEALQAVARGEVYLCPMITGIVVEGYMRQSQAAQSDPAAALTSREREVLQLLAEGKTSKEIGKALCVSAKTVESHRAQIMDKLQLHTVADLTKFAIRHGLTSVGG